MFHLIVIAILLAELCLGSPAHAQFGQTIEPSQGIPADASANPPTIPGALNLLATVAPGNRSGFYSIQNQSVNQLTVVLDDGNGNAQTVFILGVAAGAGQPGGSMDNGMSAHVGRIRVYGTAGSQVAIRVY